MILRLIFMLKKQEFMLYLIPDTTKLLLIKITNY
jgi:hypothetical protein